MDTVLVTAIGSFAADIVIKNLIKSEFNVIGCDIYRKELIADAYNVNKFYQVPLASDEEAYIEFIITICKENNVNYIIPLTDVEIDVFNKNRKRFNLNDVIVCISPTDTINICRNKKLLADFVLKSGCIQTIPTVFASDKNEITKFPVVCKPYNGRSSIGLKYIYDEMQWKAFFASALSTEYIVQPYVSGTVVTVDVVRQQNGENAVAVAREELLRTQNGAGTSVYVFREKELESRCIKLADLLGIVGCVNFEFIKDDNENYFLLECNPRFSGGVEFSCLTGYDFVLNHIRCFSGIEIESSASFNNMYIARKYEEYITKAE